MKRKNITIIAMKTINYLKKRSWLKKPVKTVIDLLSLFDNKDKLKVIDLGCGVGRNSIPIAEAIKDRSSKVVCVDLLDSDGIRRIGQKNRLA